MSMSFSSPLMMALLQLLFYARQVQSQVPTLDEMASDWIPFFSREVDTPSLSNWAGSIGTLEPDVVDTTSFIQPPLVGGR